MCERGSESRKKREGERVRVREGEVVHTYLIKGCRCRWVGCIVDHLQNALSVIAAGENDIGRVESEGRADSVGNCGQELLAARCLVPQSDGEVAGSSRVVMVQILQKN